MNNIEEINKLLSAASAWLTQPIFRRMHEGPAEIMRGDAKSALELISEAQRLLAGVVEYDEDLRQRDHWSGLSEAEKDHAIKMAK